MGFYSNFVIPYCIDLAMSDSTLSQYRQQLLKDVSGEILENCKGDCLVVVEARKIKERIASVSKQPTINFLNNQSGFFGANWSFSSIKMSLKF